MNSDDHQLSRRRFVEAGAAAAACVLRGTSLLQAEPSAPTAGSLAASGPSEDWPRPLLTCATDFYEVARGSPKPSTLVGDAVIKARLTPQTWGLEITADPFTDEHVKVPARLEKQFSRAKGSTLDLATLEELGKKHSVRYLKALQCLNISEPLGQGLWEGVPLREVLRLCGTMENVRRIYYWGYHNDDPKQIFQSSLSYTQAMETPPGDLPAFVAYRLNGEPIPLQRGGPVRMIVPWAHGFKSIKWLQSIVLTNDFRANDTYANQNNDPESHLKTAAYIDSVPRQLPAGQPRRMTGLALAGLSGLKRVEYWLRPVTGAPAHLAPDDPAYRAAQWIPCQLQPPPKDWSTVLPAGTSPKDLLGFDRQTGVPASWPLRYTMVGWGVTLHALVRGNYEFRVRAVDLNDIPQPDPRPISKSGKNAVEMHSFTVV